MSTNIKTDDLIYPYFVISGKGKAEEIGSFPGQRRFSIDKLLADIKESADLGLNKVLIFGVPAGKDKEGSFAYLKGNIVSAAVKEVKKQFPKVKVMTDVCLCAYTSHGHCGILKRHRKQIDLAATLDVLSKIAVAHAQAGADYVAPSAMAQGQVEAIRKALNEAGHKRTKIMGYSAKFASSFYGPFRNAAGSAPKFGDRRAYQLDYRHRKNALREIGDDIGEGADIVMVKPALSYLDIIRDVRSEYRTPLAAYNVSGEYVFVKYGARKGLWRERDIVFEIMTSIKRAGADFIITYHAKDIARWLKE